MNITKKIDLDIRQIDSLKAFHLHLKELFGFFDGYGENIHALIDCLRELRDPEEESITRFTIQKDESIAIRVIGYTPERTQNILHTLLLAVNAVNNHEVLYVGRTPSIYLLFQSDSLWD